MKKLTNESFSVDSISFSEYPKARAFVSDIQKRAHEIERELYDNEKKLKEFTRKK